MTKAALLIGINYRGTDSELNGCINDIVHTEKVLRDEYGFIDIKRLTDDTHMKPTGANIVRELYDLVLRTYTQDLRQIWVSYSGHGYFVRDQGGDEKDGRDEVIIPIDCDTNGYVSDDLIRRVLSMANPKTKCVCIFDCCHSGTVLDLKYKYEAGNKCVIENECSDIKADVIMVSGCMDTQTSADAYNVLNAQKYQGAITASLLHSLKEHDYSITCYQLLKHMRAFLKDKGFDQVPQLTSSRKLNNISIFSAKRLNVYMESER